ncbi:AMP-binding protein [Streptomyces sp. NPDC098789]|uniref:AMP-binding protein n=1 Tax=Streptomyces sp. NPDC098789 TaxID=3366098 RepID=UPI0037F4D446
MTGPFSSPADAWQRIAARTDRTLTITDEVTETLTHQALAERAASYLPALRELGVGRGEPVLITVHTTIDFICAYLALMLHGAVPVPLPPRQVLKGSGPFLARLRPLLPHHRRLICTPAELEEVGPTSPAECDISTFPWLAERRDADFGRSAAQQLAAGATADWLLPAMDDDAYVQYTSGSTAAPRGIVITHRNLLANLDATGRGLDVRPTDVVASWLPLHHDMGLVTSLLTALFHGIDAVFTLPQRFLYDPLGFLRLTTHHNATHALMPNFALEWLVNARNKPHATLHGIDMSSLRRLTIASEPVNADSMRRFNAAYTEFGLADTALCSGYGLAEATCAVSLSVPGTGFRTEDFEGTEVVTGGRLLQGYEARIDAEPGRRAGTIKLRGPGMSASSYIDGTRVDALEKDGFYDTRDVGYLVEDEVVILGRQDEVIILHGENRFPYDIESVVRAESRQGRSRVACFGHLGRIVVVREGRGSTPADEAEDDGLRQRITKATGLPIDELVTVPHGAVPVTTSGKIKRAAIAEAYRAGTLPTLTTRTWTPCTPAPRNSVR